jgi:hypothetical protein
MNPYGYDYFVPNDALYFDETSYLETIKPLNKVENFQNEIDLMVNDEEENENGSFLQKALEKKDILCNQLYDNFKRCTNMIKYKNHQMQQMHQQLFIFYVLFIFAILFIFYQRININSLNTLIYLLKRDNKTLSKST